jgi:uncharacterized membrane protein SirB2
MEFYGEIRWVHVAAVISSGTIFFLRGVSVWAGRQGWALAPLPRYLSYLIDTTLLAAGITLLTILPTAVFANGWVVAKIALLPVYIGLGMLALHGNSRWQPGFFAGALLVYGGMFSMARAHHPLGLLLHYW